MLCVAAAPSHAQPFPPITDRDYTIDLYQGTVLGSTRVIGMGGAQVAAAEGSAGNLTNPAAVALRTATSKGSWDWDFHLSAIDAIKTNDADNNGIVEGERQIFKPVQSYGIMYQRRRVGFGVTAMIQNRLVSEEGETPVVTNSYTVDLLFGMNFFDEQLVTGAALRLAGMSIHSDGDQVFSQADIGTHLGAVYKPAGQNYRIGAALIKSFGAKQDVSGNCDPFNCVGYILPNRVQIPWRLSTGFAWRFGASRWNDKAPDFFRDERSVIVEGDLVVTGPLKNGAGIEAFGDMQLQPSGVDPNFSMRLGADFEWLPGRLRLRGGSYFEPARFQAPDGADVKGRLHVTIGLEVRLFSFHFWDTPYRVSLSLASDASRRYSNGAISLGFWD